MMENLELSFSAWRLAVKYYYLAEVYDRQVCTGPLDRDGNIMPANGSERGKINQNAMQLMRQIRQETWELGISEDELKNAMEGASRLTFRGLTEEWTRLNKTETEALKNA